jgi:hypothetical protein
MASSPLPVRDGNSYTPSFLPKLCLGPPRDTKTTIHVLATPILIHGEEFNLPFSSLGSETHYSLNFIRAMLIVEAKLKIKYQAVLNSQLDKNHWITLNKKTTH